MLPLGQPALDQPPIRFLPREREGSFGGGSVVGSRAGARTVGRMVENLGCLYLIEVAQVGCILDRTISSCLQPEERL
jgi:hypothetical protein